MHEHGSLKPLGEKREEGEKRHIFPLGCIFLALHLLYTERTVCGRAVETTVDYVRDLWIKTTGV